MRPYRSITGPLVLILLGTVFLMHTLSPSIQIFDLIGRYWPWLLIGWGTVGLLEAVLQFSSGGAMPVRPVSTGSWFLVLLVCFLGLAAYQFRRPDAWWHQMGFERGIEAFGEEHEYSLPTLQKTVGRKPHIVIENFRGDAKITGSDRQDITLSGHKMIRTMNTADADRGNEATPIELVNKGDTVVIRCNQDRFSSRGTLTTNLELEVPKDASLEATGSRGDFDVSALTGDVDISSENAGLRLQDIAGRVKIDTRRSDLIRCTSVQGTVDLRGHGQDVELTRIGGQVTISGSYSGSLALHELAKPVRVENLRTEFDVQQVPGEIRLERGSISMRNVIGPTRLTTRTTDVTLEGFSNGLNLTADHGDIELRPGHVPLGRIDVHTKAGNIEVDMPQSAGFALKASTDRGEISSEFGNALEQTAHGRGARLEGSVGQGPDVSLVTNRGRITLRKTTGTEAVSKAAMEPVPIPVTDLVSAH